LQHVAHAVRAGGREGPALELADGDDVRAEGQRLQHVAAPQHAAVHYDLSASGDGFDDFRQRVQAANAVVQLAAAVVGHPDHVDAALHGGEGVLRRGDALEHHGQTARHLPDTVEVVPGQLGQVVAAGAVAEAGRDGFAEHGALPTAVDRHVGGHAEANVAGRLYAR